MATILTEDQAIELYSKSDDYNWYEDELKNDIAKRMFPDGIEINNVRYAIGNYINDGEYGVVTNLCPENSIVLTNCDLVIKIVSISQFNKLGDVIKEYEYMQKMYELGIGPKPYEMLFLEFDGHLFAMYIMEQIAETVRSRLRSRAYSERQLQSTADELEEIIDKLNDSGYNHGDLHSGNVVYDRNGSLKLIDFGAMFKIEPNMQLTEIDHAFGTVFDLYDNCNDLKIRQRAKYKQCTDNVNGIIERMRSKSPTNRGSNSLSRSRSKSPRIRRRSYSR